MSATTKTTDESARVCRGCNACRVSSASALSHHSAVPGASRRAWPRGLMRLRGVGLAHAVMRAGAASSVRDCCARAAARRLGNGWACISTRRVVWWTHGCVGGLRGCACCALRVGAAGSAGESGGSASRTPAPSLRRSARRGSAGTRTWTASGLRAVLHGQQRRAPAAAAMRWRGEVSAGDALRCAVEAAWARLPGCSGARCACCACATRAGAALRLGGGADSDRKSAAQGLHGGRGRIWRRVVV